MLWETERLHIVWLRHRTCNPIVQQQELTLAEKGLAHLDGVTARPLYAKLLS